MIDLEQLQLIFTSEMGGFMKEGKPFAIDHELLMKAVASIRTVNG